MRSPMDPNYEILGAQYMYLKLYEKSKFFQWPKANWLVACGTQTTRAQSCFVLTFSMSSA